MRQVKLLIIFLIFLPAVIFALPDEKAPEDIEQLFNGYFREYIELSPETVASLGITEQQGIKIQNDELDDVSVEALDKLYKMYKKYSDWLSQYDRDKLTPSQQINSDILEWFLDNELQGEQFKYHKYIINSMFGFHNQLTTLMTEHHKIEEPLDAENYIKRLMKYKVKVSGLLEQLAIREQKGIIPPIFIIETFQQVLNDFIKVPYSENILFTSFKRRIQNLNTIDDESKEELYQKVLDALENNVYPSYIEMIKYISSLKEKANEKVGVCNLPNGDEYYEYCLHWHTTTTLSPEEIHNLGLKEVNRIQGEIKTHFETLGISGSEKFSDLMATYRRIYYNRYDERYFYPFNQKGERQTLKRYQAIIDSMSMKLPEMFSLIPEAPVRVERVPEFKERTAGTYYQSPKLDGSSGGIFYANLTYQHFKPGMKSLAYHEAIPGHHFQIAIEQESPNFRLFKSLFFFTGYGEGWALYAEKLAKEYGFYKNIHSLLGYLGSELFRAARLVVDTGIHYKKWTREKAYQYMVDNLGRGFYQEIDRYIVWPGQACAYKIGELKVLELRERAKKELGEKFDIKEFHRVILKHGSIPLEILEQLVDDYIKVTKNNNL
ncbi:hypothetical protein ES703_23659 [subsurface metagenome]